MIGKLAVVAGLALALPVAGATATPERTDAREARLQRALDQLVAAGAPGAIALVRRGDRTVRLASGYGNLKPRARIRATDRFRIGSVTKTFVATLVLQLVGEGKIGLDDTVEHWLPGVVPNGQAITVRRLLNMTSGLFDYLNDGDTTVADRVLSGDWGYQWPPRELVAIATAHPPHFAPGAGWWYCNTCYVLLGLIVEQATGGPIAAELSKRVFAPAGLRATSFESQARISGRHAHGHELFGRRLVDVTGISPSLAWTAGAIVSTPDDVARFYRALLRGRLLRPDLLRAMETTVLVGPEAPGWEYGLGLGKFPLPCGAVWGHSGGLPGYRTWALNSKDGRRQVVVFTNLGQDSLSRRATRALERAFITGYCDVSARL